MATKSTKQKLMALSLDLPRIFIPLDCIRFILTLVKFYLAW